ncbi:hypothetical protein Tco_0160562, partial [Tanacetum coccineum]
MSVKCSKTINCDSFSYSSKEIHTPTVDKADEMILQDTLQVSLAEHKSREEQEARENVELVNKHLASVEIEKMPRSDTESPEVEITNDEEVEITNVVIPVNVNKEEEEITKVSHRIHTDLVSSDTEKLQELTVTDTTPTPSLAIDTNIPSLVDASIRSYMSGHILHVHTDQPQITSVTEQQYQLYLSMKADPQLQQQDIAIWLALQMKFDTS